LYVTFLTKYLGVWEIDSLSKHNRAAEQRSVIGHATQSKIIKRDHTGNINSMNWDKEKLKQEVEGYEDGVKVNWSSLARQYGIKTKSGNYAKNGGQIAQQYLVNEGVNVHRFKRQHEDQSNKKNRIRRKKLRGLGGRYMYLLHDCKRGVIYI
jgi:hypothetical protein